MNTQTPKGRTHLQNYEKQIILDMRLRGYSLQQIAEYTERSMSSIKRVVYNW